MSRRYSQNNNRQQQQEWRSNNSSNFSKPQTKFVPKNQNPNSNPTLSDSLRQSLSSQSDAAAAAAPASSGNMGAGESSSRIQMRDDGAWMSRKAVAGVQGGGKFVTYLPQDEAVAAGLGADEGGLDPVESQRVVDLLSRELSRLLKLKPKEFWKEVASDVSLHDFLDSFLKFRSRWYDFPHRGVKGIVAGVIVGELDLCRRVFMVLYRISSNRAPGVEAAESLNSKDHAVLLQEKKLLDLPKLLDICSIYGHENEELTGLLVLLSAGSHEDHRSSPLLTDYLEVMDFINDAIVSMDAFVTAYESAAVFFSCPVEMSHGNEEMLITLARLHDTLIPALQRGFRVILTGGDDRMILNVAVSLKMLSMRLSKFGWKLLDTCYLSDRVFEDHLPIPHVTKMFPAKVEDPVIRTDILIQTFREINGVLLAAQENQSKVSFLQNLDRNHHIMSRLQSLQNAGWIFMDDEQLQYLSGIMASNLKGTIKDSPAFPTATASNKVQMGEDVAIMESKISQIKDLFPDYGKGFLAACLEAYNHNPEEVIQRILEGTLHEDLRCLDTSSETMPLPKAASTVGKKDKGKGKLVESTLPSTTSLHSVNPVVPVEQRQVEGPSVSSSSTTGRFVRKPNDIPGHYTTDTRDHKDTARMAALISQYEYEDEYDDSFDDLGFSVADSGVEENELLGNRINSNSGISSGTKTETSAQNSPNTKWGSRKKPQYYVKDGKNYSYKVAGSVAVANANEASLINQVHGEQIHGLGRGGNIPLGATKKLAEYQEKDRDQSDEPEMEGRGNYRGRPWGRGSRGGGRLRESNDVQDNQSDGSEIQGRESTPNHRGRGRGRGSNHNYRKDRAMNKHFSGLSGF
ncbi:uncharacterized protein LOC7488872 isoform X2 [Populus trichocarpa]|uniref:uncharacterized protein LOC7488872 isoform X2 n=1 Tax=Populus trichocarpa TaxID=3694 RepID=UPI0022795BA2|nr:uncharacterized protein LOC7488872 isoform X2 [Populus trichocarpa]